MADLRTRDVAAEINASVETVRSLISTGVLDAYRLNGDSGPYRVRPESVEEYRQRQKDRDPWARTRPRHKTA